MNILPRRPEKCFTDLFFCFLPSLIFISKEFVIIMLNFNLSPAVFLYPSIDDLTDVLMSTLSPNQRSQGISNQRKNYFHLSNLTANGINDKLKI